MSGTFYIVSAIIVPWFSLLRTAGLDAVLSKIPLSVSSDRNTYLTKPLGVKPVPDEVR